MIRDGVPMDFTVRIEARTNEIASDSRNLWPGVWVSSLTDDIRSSLNIGNNGRGLFVSQISPGSPSAVVGIDRGDIITAVSGIPVSDLASFYRAIRENTGRELWFNFTRGGNNLESIRFQR